MARAVDLTTGGWLNTGSDYGGLLLPGLSLLNGLTWAPVFGRHPKVAKFQALRTITVTTAAEWNAALSGMLAGDRVYVTTSFTVSQINRTISGKDGTEAYPWMIEFAPGVQISGTGVSQALQMLTVTNCDWGILKNIRLTTANQALWIRQSNHIFLDSCQIWNVGQEAFHWFDHSTYFDAWNCSGWDTGRNSLPNGEVFYLGSDEGAWANASFNSAPTTPELNSYASVRQCHFGHDVSREWIEFKAGLSFGYAIGNTGDGVGFNSADAFSKSPFAAKGDDLFYFWNEGFYPNENLFHSYTANSANTMGTGSWGNRHTWYGNLGHMDESTYTGANTKRLIDAPAGKGHVVYDNNRSASASITVVNTANVALTATPNP